MQKHIDMVREFMEKHRFPTGIKPGSNPSIDLIRIHLIQEELSELSLSIAKEDLVGIADALGDLIYVVFGAAITYGIPLKEIFEEIQRSNMTKEVRKDGDPRLRDKGNTFVPPNIKGIMRLNGWSDEVKKAAMDSMKGLDNAGS